MLCRIKCSSQQTTSLWYGYNACRQILGQSAVAVICGMAMWFSQYPYCAQLWTVQISHYERHIDIVLCRREPSCKKITSQWAPVHMLSNIQALSRPKYSISRACNWVYITFQRGLQSADFTLWASYWHCPVQKRALLQENHIPMSTSPYAE